MSELGCIATLDLCYLGHAVPERACIWLAGVQVLAVADHGSLVLLDEVGRFITHARSPPVLFSAFCGVPAGRPATHCSQIPAGGEWNRPSGRRSIGTGHLGSPSWWRFGRWSCSIDLGHNASCR
jgi:hypothetical protein